MADSDTPSNLPVQIAEALVGIPKALVPSSVKALDRLVGALVDIPVAKLAQWKAGIDAQTRSFNLVEEAIATAAASEVGGDKDVVARSIATLVRKSYRKQTNRESVAAAMIQVLGSPEEPTPHATASEQPVSSIDEDWLNVFERYAEDASTERMQKLWGRVLAGELRSPGRFSLRTLRFLSEFSQADAVTFADFCDSVFGEAAPKDLAKPKDGKDIRSLLFLESSGLVQGASDLGLSRTLTFGSNGYAFMREGNLALCMQGEAGSSIKHSAIPLTPLGQELLTLLPTRDARAAARRVAEAIRCPEIKSAFLAVVTNEAGNLAKMEILWQESPAVEDPAAQ